MTRWSIHNCWTDPDCAMAGRVARLSLDTPGGTLILSWRHGSWTQAWLPLLGWQQWWSPIVWHPKA